MSRSKHTADANSLTLLQDIIFTPGLWKASISRNSIIFIFIQGDAT